MKLCKDCKHALLPHPLQTSCIGSYVFAPTCAHPNAERDTVYGRPITTCDAARGTWVFGATNKSVCWPDAKLFEERPPTEPEPKDEIEPALAVDYFTEGVKTSPPRVPWLKRIFG